MAKRQYCINKMMKYLKLTNNLALRCFSVCLFAVLSLTVSAKEYKYSSVAGDMMQTRIYTLDNGLKVYLSVNLTLTRHK